MRSARSASCGAGRTALSRGPFWCRSSLILGPPTGTPSLAWRRGHGAMDRALQPVAGIYWTVNACKPDLAKKATKADVEWLLGIWGDLDPVKGRDLPIERERLLRLAEELMALPWPPTVIIDSGGGIQPLWRLETPLEAAAGVPPGDRGAWPPDRGCARRCREYLQHRPRPEAALHDQPSEPAQGRAGPCARDVRHPCRDRPSLCLGRPGSAGDRVGRRAAGKRRPGRVPRAPLYQRSR